MNALLLAQGHSASTDNIIAAFKERGHNLDVVYYHDNLNAGGVPTAHITSSGFLDDGKLIAPSDYDIAMLRCWGTAPIGARFLAECEKAGVTVLNPTADTAVMNSKIASARLFRRSSVPFPKSLVYEGSVHARQTFNFAAKGLGTTPIVFKADYGTHGKAIRFISNPDDLQNSIDDFAPHNPGFVLQEFIGDPHAPISHYRAIVNQEFCLGKGFRLTAPQPNHASNRAQGAAAQLVDLPEDVKNTAVQAAIVSKLAFSGVDIMLRTDGTPVVLEVNDSPATNGFDEAGINASRESVLALEERHQQPPAPHI